MRATASRRSPAMLLGVAALIAITGGALALRLIGLEGVRPNWFYDAAVRSMGRSWHNFFFAAFDPAGRVAVVQPPVARGWAGAAVLAVLPIAVLTARSSTMDTTATTFVLLAAWLVVVACEPERPALLVLAAAVVGLAFNVKLFEALLPVPALALLYVLGTRAPWRRRVMHLAAAGAV